MNVSEDKAFRSKLFRMGLKISQMKTTKAEVTKFAIDYAKQVGDYPSQSLLDIINSYVDGNNINYIADTMQCDPEVIQDIFHSFGIQTHVSDL